MPTFPLWSNVMFGVIERYKASLEKTSDHTEHRRPQKTNGVMEKRFQLLKNNYFNSQTFSRLDEFSARLEKHITSTQSLACIRTVKRTPKKAAETIHEEWEKPGKRSIPVHGKYQSKPMKNIQTHRVKEDRKEERITGQEEKNIVEEERNTGENLFKRETVACGLKKTYWITAPTAIKEIYCNDISDQIYTTFLKWKDTFCGIQNLGNTCWFNAVIGCFAESSFLLECLDKYAEDLSYGGDSRPILQVADCVARHQPISKELTQKIVGTVTESLEMSRRRQNDANEFFMKGITKLMGLSEKDYNIKLEESITCVTCGEISKNVEVLTDFSLSVDYSYSTFISVKDLLNKYFEDQEMFCASCQYCQETTRWKTSKAIQLPEDITITLLRYWVDKYGRVKKNRLKICVDNVLNLGDYTDSKDPALYRLNSAVLHHGQQPSVGHYTALQKIGNTFIEFDDQTVNLATSNIETDGYMLVYKQLPTELVNLDIPLICFCIRTLFGFNTMVQINEEVPFGGPRRRNVIESMEKLSISGCEYKHHHRLYKDIDDQILEKNERNLKNTIESLISYLLRPNESVLEHCFGIEEYIFKECNQCKYISTSQSYSIVKDHPSSSTLLKCLCCSSSDVVERREATSFGKTVILHKVLEATDIDENPDFSKLFNYYRPLEKCLYRPVAVLVQGSGIVMTRESNHLLETFGELCRITRKETESIIEGVEGVVFYDLEEFREVTAFEIKDISNLNILLQQDKEQEREKVDISLSNDKFEIVENFHDSVNCKGIYLEPNDFERMLEHEFRDNIIDSYMEVLKTRSTINVHFLPSSWYKDRIEQSLGKKPDSRNTWNNKDDVLIPVNIENRHWVLVVVRPQSNAILYLDPLGLPIKEDIFGNVASYAMYKLCTEGEVFKCIFNVYDCTGCTCAPIQRDHNSCGAYVCLYAKLLTEGLVFQSDIVPHASVLRKYLLWEIINEFYIHNSNVEFGLRDAMLCHELPNLVHSIVTATAVDDRLVRHNEFVSDCYSFSAKMLVGFAAEFIDEESDVLYKLQEYLLRRFFTTSVTKTSILQRDVMKISTDEEATTLNKILRKDCDLASRYVETVLFKEVFLYLLELKLKIGYAELNTKCTKTEHSFVEAKRRHREMQRKL